MRTEEDRLGRVDRFERRLQGLVGDAFARVFGGSVVPQEVVQALLREAEDHIEELAGGRLLAPNRFTVLLSPTDLDRMAGDRAEIVNSLSASVTEQLADQGWDTYGEVVVFLERSDALHTGQFRTRSTVDPDASRRDAIRARDAGEAPMSQQPGHPEENGQYGYDRGAPADTGSSRRTPRPPTTSKPTRASRATASRATRSRAPAATAASSRAAATNRATAASPRAAVAATVASRAGTAASSKVAATVASPRVAGTRASSRAATTRATASSRAAARTAASSRAVAATTRVTAASPRATPSRAVRLWRPAAGLRPGRRVRAGLRPAAAGRLPPAAAVRAGLRRRVRPGLRRPAGRLRRLPAAAAASLCWTTARAAPTTSPRAATSSGAGRIRRSGSRTPACRAGTWRSAGMVRRRR